MGFSLFSELGALNPAATVANVGASAFELWKMGRASDEAEFARDWSANMSNTAYQRAVVDMRAAGINPALAYMQGGASTPTAAVADVPQGNPFTTGFDVFKTRTETGRIEAELERVRHQVGIANFERMTASQMYDILLHTYPDLEKQVKSEAARAYWEAQAARLKIPAAKAEADFWSSPLGESGVGKFLQFFRSILR